MSILFLELGVGMNTPVIIKYPFWRMTAQNPNAIYACVNFGESACPKGIEKQSICLNMDIFTLLNQLTWDDEYVKTENFDWSKGGADENPKQIDGGRSACKMYSYEKRVPTR